MSGESFRDPYLGRRAFETLVDRLAAIQDATPIDQLVNDFCALRPGDRARLRSTLALLSRMGAISTGANGELIPQFDFNTVNVVSQLARSLVRWLRDTGTLSQLSSALQIDTDHLLIDTLVIPWRLNYLRHLLLELSVFEREDVGIRYWSVSGEFAEMFLEAARDTNLAATSPSVSFQDLNARLDLQVELGIKAEEWALNRELLRLADHKLLALVRRISDDAVDAGYDIISFSSSRSLVHDRFIEVKSYSETTRFYWSSNEVQTAQKLGREYVLVLVDRRQLSDPNYEPIEISDPYPYFFSADLEGWSVQAASWVFERLADTTL
jgi:hypothetical protein